MLLLVNYPNARHDPLRLSIKTSTMHQSSQLAEPLWTDPGTKSEISVYELISSKKLK